MTFFCVPPWFDKNKLQFVFLKCYWTGLRVEMKMSWPVRVACKSRILIYSDEQHFFNGNIRCKTIFPFNEWLVPLLKLSRTYNYICTKEPCVYDCVCYCKMCVCSKKEQWFFKKKQLLNHACLSLQLWNVINGDSVLYLHAHWSPLAVYFFNLLSQSFSLSMLHN